MLVSWKRKLATLTSLPSFSALSLKPKHKAEPKHTQPPAPTPTPSQQGQGQNQGQPPQASQDQIKDLPEPQQVVAATGPSPLPVRRKSSAFFPSKVSLPTADVNLRDPKYGATPLYYACQRGQAEEVKRLLSVPGVDVNSVAECTGGAQFFTDDYRFPSKFYRTPLLIACARGHLEIVRLLLGHPKIEVNLLANNVTPLHAAVYNGQAKVVQLLLQDPRVDVNAGDNSGNTPLHVCCSVGAVSCLSLLLKHPKINLEAHNQEGVVPFLLAIGNHDKEIIDVMLAHYRGKSRSA